MDFTEFPKLPRWSRDVIVTEKIDGTNASIHIRPLCGVAEICEPFEFGVDVQVDVNGQQGYLRAGSRTRWISMGDDNYGFARWAYDNAHDLAALGFGHHFGEWWGRGIQRNYARPDRQFSLFNVTRWAETRPDCCEVVPTLYMGPLVPGLAERRLAELKIVGSAAAPGFMQPEGIVLFHTAANLGFKKTIEKDESPKSTWTGNVPHNDLVIA